MVACLSSKTEVAVLSFAAKWSLLVQMVFLMSAGQPQSLARFAPWFFMSSLWAAIFSPGFWSLVCVFFEAHMPRRPFGACLTKTLFDAKAQGVLRDLDVVELWSGGGLHS